jgi:hypothetical protein
MTTHNTDPDLVQMTRELINGLRRFYAMRMGVLYILHVNWLYWLIYVILRPLLICLGVNKRLVIVRKPAGRLHLKYCPLKSFYVYIYRSAGIF